MKKRQLKKEIYKIIKAYRKLMEHNYYYMFRKTKRSKMFTSLPFDNPIIECNLSALGSLYGVDKYEDETDNQYRKRILAKHNERKLN